MPLTPDVPIDTLLSHASGLRALARSLLGDEDAAEDVVQETWIVALEKRPSGGTPLGGWLRSVARHLALKRRRGESRRASRERLASRDEALMATDDAVAQREALQRVVNAVLDLEEVYSQALLMRYFQGLGPREIAARLKVPVATVDSRLHRARARLRERLDAADGGERTRWVSALAAATGWTGEELASSSSPGVLGGMVPLGSKAMEWKVILIGAGALTLALAGTRSLSTPQRETSGAEWSAAKPGAISSHSADLHDPEQDAPELPSSDRTPAEAASGALAIPLAPSQPPGRFAYRLEGRVVDTHDLPVASASVSFVPPGHPLAEFHSSDADGRFTLTFEAHTARMQGVLWVDAQFAGFAPAPARRIELAAGTNLVRTVLIPAGSSRQVLPAQSTQPDVPDVLFFDWPTPGSDELIDETVGVIDPTALEQLRLLGYTVSQPIQARRAQRVSQPPGTVHITGTVFGADGEPAAHASLVLRSAASGKLHWVRSTHTAGAYELHLPAGHYRLIAGGGTFGLATRTWDFDEDDLGTERVWSPVLDRGREIHGRVTLASGEPADGWMVELELDGEPLHCDATLTSNGAFALPNVAGNGRLHLIAPGDELATHVVEGVVPGPEPLEIVVPERQGFLQVSIHALDLPEMHAAEVWVCQTRTGRTTWLLWSDARAAHGQSLPAGTYHVIVGDAEHGYVDLGRVELAQGGEVALRAVLPSRGAVTWTPPTAHGDLLWTLFRRGPSVSSRLSSGVLTEPPAYPLPAGDYELFVHGDDVSAAATRFAVAAGSTVELELDPEELHELAVRLVLPDGSTAPVSLAIEDAQSGVATHTQQLAGPGLRIHLRTGRYVVTARSADGREVSRSVQLPGTGEVELELR